MVLIVLLAAAVLVGAWQAVSAKKLLTSAIYLALSSAVLAILFYLTGAVYLAVFELSIGAGLVTVLFVFAISVSGGEPLVENLSIPRGAAWFLVLFSMALLGWMALPLGEETAASAQTGTGFSTELWHGRGLDLLVQIAQIFSGVLGILGLLGEAKAPLQYPIAEEISRQRVLELNAMLNTSVEQEER